MRKVLLATTALVALGGVSAASAADVTLSGKTMFNASSWSDNQTDTGGANNTTMSTSFEVDVTASATTDNGLTWSTNIDLHDNSENMSISGDGFTLYLSDADDGDGDAFATSADPVADEDYGGHTIQFNGNEAVVGGKVSLKSTFGPVSFALASSDAGSSSSADSFAYGISYTTEAAGATITLQYAASDSNTATGSDGDYATSMGVKITSGDLGIILASNTKEVNNGSTTSNDYTGNGVSLTYKLSDVLSVAAQSKSADDDRGNYEFNETAGSVSYTIGAGMAAHLSVTDFDQKGVASGYTAVNGTSTELEIAVSF
jgi:hypothetical protein